MPRFVESTHSVPSDHNLLLVGREERMTTFNAVLLERFSMQAQRSGQLVRQRAGNSYELLTLSMTDA